MTQDLTTRFDIELRARGVTQASCSRVSGISPVTINEIARGWRRPSPRHVTAICECLTWPIEDAAALFELVPRSSMRDNAERSHNAGD
jgi:transcriptional regulator with XRE-family HTH domain